MIANIRFFMDVQKNWKTNWDFTFKISIILQFKY